MAEYKVLQSNTFFQKDDEMSAIIIRWTQKNPKNMLQTAGVKNFKSVKLLSWRSQLFSAYWNHRGASPDYSKGG